VAIIAWFVAQLATYFVKSEIEKLKDFLLRRNRVPRKLSGHVVFVNWNEQAEQIVEQLHGPDIEEKRTILIITMDEKLTLPTRTAFNQCILVCGDPTDQKLLAEARVSEAHSVVILSAGSLVKETRGKPGMDTEVADAKTILTILAIRSLATELTKPENQRRAITAEVMNGKNLEAAKVAGRGGRTEVICAESVGANLFAQCALTPGLAVVFEDLLTFAPDTDEIYKVRVPRLYHGKLFSEIMRDLAERSSKADAVIPLGVFRSPNVYLNPGPELGALRSDDYLFVICDHESTLERVLMQRANAATHSRR
jgi:Trk K+ transport system NAD-binding subunit